ncbi:MAG TPA: ATP-binding protein [Paraburkholderia sp.]|uniref:sensor histidine kinase n=1 Tax=Paraburkholderia sp. TaxID=1926495 RepID=UPI002B4A6C35|nr:ATP-binding protein [Paraburkholderia sp.]HKR38660.1 ATP-binding protein [Paraburkholderia sp.]
MHRLCRAIVAGLLLASLPAFAAEPARVVILVGADPLQPAALVQIKALRNMLETSAPHGAEVYLDAIDGFRFGTDDLSPEFLALLKKKYAAQRIDLIVGLGNHAADFALQYHAQLWPGAPVLLSSVPEEWFGRHALPAGFSHVPFRIDVTKTLAIAEELQPDARHLVVIGGTTDTDYSFIDRVVKAATARGGQWRSVEAWRGLPPHELEQRLAHLDNQTAVVYTTMYRDREGHRYLPYQVVPGLVAASRAPIYAWYSTYLDGGVTAGAMYDFEENGRLTAQAALSILNGEGGIEAPTFAPLPARCTANATQLERYGLSAVDLPADCGVIDQPKSIFRDYRGVVLTALAVLLAQTLTIVALLAQRRSRRLAEAEVTARRSELARAARFAAVGELSASIAHEVGQPLGAILSNADAAELLVKASHLEAAELGEILSDVKRDALRANDVVQRLRSLLQKQSVDFSQLSLDATLQCALKLIAPEASRRNISVEEHFNAGNAEIMGDAVQIQQVVLNLAINAMDAMQDSAQSSRILTLATKRLADGIELNVADRGCSFGSASVQRLFEPFYTTKPHGMGLGLSIVRSIVEAHQGRVDAAARDGGGTVFTVWLPYARALADTDPAGAPHVQPRAPTPGRPRNAAPGTSS